MDAMFVAGFASELLKEAKEKKQPEAGSALAAGFGAQTAANIGATAMGIAGLAGEKPMTGKEYRQFQKTLREGGKDVKVHRGKAPFAIMSQMQPKGLQGPLGEKTQHHLALTKKPGPAAAYHEAGHARGEFGGKARAAVGRASIRARQGLSIARPATGGYSIYKAVTAPESAEGKAAPYVMAATSPNIVRLPGEAMASTWALAKIKKNMGTKAMLKASPRLGLAFGTYAAGVAAPAAVTELMRRVAKPGPLGGKKKLEKKLEG